MNIETLPWKDITTIALAAVGAVLGIMNTWNALSQRRVRLIVRPTLAYFTTGGPPMFSISVTNMSTFPLTISEVGFTGWRGTNGKRAVCTSAHPIDGKEFPRRLASREAISLYFDVSNLPRDPKFLAKAYALTDCGETAYGTSEALNDVRKIARES